MFLKPTPSGACFASSSAAPELHHTELLSTPPHFIKSLTIMLEIPPSDPSTSSLEKVGPPSTHHSHQARDTETQSRGTSSLVKADVDVDKRDSPRLPNVHLVKADVDVDKRDSPRLSLPLLLDSTLRPLLLVSS